jgi:hypothetical protein
VRAVHASRVARPACAYAASLHARGGDSGVKDAAERRILITYTAGLVPEAQSSGWESCGLVTLL